jgi:uncharacterized protein (TIGR02246 family)
MMDAASLVDSYIAAWNERDAEARAEAVAGVFADDARYVDPLADVTGRNEIACAVVGFLDKAPAA